MHKGKLVALSIHATKLINAFQGVSMLKCLFAGAGFLEPWPRHASTWMLSVGEHYVFILLYASQLTIYVF